MRLNGRRHGRHTKTCVGGSGHGGSPNSNTKQPTARSCVHQTTRPYHPLLLTDFDTVPEILPDRASAAPVLMLPNPDLLQVESADLHYRTRIDDRDKFRAEVRARHAVPLTAGFRQLSAAAANQTNLLQQCLAVAVCDAETFLLAPAALIASTQRTNPYFQRTTCVQKLDLVMLLLTIAVIRNTKML
jgi:hypothetical protein